MSAGKHRADVPVREGFAFIVGRHERRMDTSQAVASLLARRAERMEVGR